MFKEPMPGVSMGDRRYSPNRARPSFACCCIISGARPVCFFTRARVGLGYGGLAGGAGCMHARPHTCHHSVSEPTGIRVGTAPPRVRASSGVRDAYAFLPMHTVALAALHVPALHAVITLGPSHECPARHAVPQTTQHAKPNVARRAEGEEMGMRIRKQSPTLVAQCAVLRVANICACALCVHHQVCDDAYAFVPLHSVGTPAVALSVEYVPASHAVHHDVAERHAHTTHTTKC